MAPLERYEELQELHESLSDISPRDSNSVHELEQVAHRAISIIQGWPAEDWQQWEDEHEDMVWPLKEHALEGLQRTLQNTEIYKMCHPTVFDFDGWMSIMRELSAALWWYREESDQEEDEL